MIVLACGLVLTAVLLARAAYQGGRRTADLGTMSHHWIADHQASQPANPM